jgi:hypothetical protein
LESPAKVVRMQYRKMLSVYSDTNEIGNWPPKIELFGGRC